MQFYKFQGLGNDFLIVREAELRADTADYGEFARRLCERHFGAGADGVEVVLEKKRTAAEADYEVRLFNADGGETPISGNGTRCVAAYLYQVEGWLKPNIRIATDAGIKQLKLLKRASGSFIIEAEMGTPRLMSAEIPVTLGAPADRVIRQPLEVNGQRLEFTAVSMGNPHCSILIDQFGAVDFAQLNWRALGAALEVHPAFPDRTNVEFIRVISRDEIEVRFWERGCGETLASGTGGCAAALATMLNELAERKVKVNTAAGALEVEWRADNVVMQTGEARAVYRAELF